MYTHISRPIYSLAIPLILLLALIFLSTPVVAQNPIANAYYCRMRCDASFSICVNTMGKFSLRQAALFNHPNSIQYDFPLHIRSESEFHAAQ